jgi:serine/threonine protein kinase
MAVAFLHENRVIHRDIKPTNVLFQYHARNRLLCKLIDFGSCFALSPNGSQLFNPKLFTTPRFNLTYRHAAKLTASAICDRFTQHEYETHELFDIYGIAETVSFLLENSSHRLPCLDVVIAICKHPDPNLRFTPEELLTVIRRLKLGLASKQLDPYFN